MAGLQEGRGIALLSQDEAQKTTDPLSFDVMAELIKTVPPRQCSAAAAAALTGAHRRCGTGPHSADAMKTS
jgi:hypothetical protein